MPYVPRNDRPEMDEHLRPLIEAIGDRPGHLNYAISILLLGFSGDTPGYATLSEAHSQALCAAAEYYRTVMAPYEDAKKVANGPLVVPR